MRSLRLSIIVGGFATLAVASCLGNTSCGAGTAANGSSGSGSLIAVGDVPVPIAHPVGVAVRGSHSGSTVWILAGGAAGALAAAEVRAAHLVGGSSKTLSTTGDPCHHKPNNAQVASWKKGRVFLDCAGWRQIKRAYSNISVKNLQTVLRCIQRVIVLGARTNLTSGPYSIEYRYESLNRGDTPSFVLVQSNGRIFSASSKSWNTCGSD